MSEQVTGNNIDVQASYDAYAELTHEYGQLSPQHQGLTAEEFAEALYDPAVAKTAHDVDGDIKLIPQLAPVERNEWLNAGFYEKTFPQEYAQGNVLQFVDIPNVTPGPEVQARLRELAAAEGVVVFDYPMTDPDYPARVQRLLADQGIIGAEPVELGNQTYFAGQTTLKRREYPLPPPEETVATFDAMVADGRYDTSRIDNGASIMRVIDEDQAAHMLKFYEDAYQVLNDHPCKQGLSPEEFNDMMTKKSWVTKFVNSVDGEITALCLLDNNLDELTWVNGEYYKERYPDRMAKGQVMWFPGLAANPNSEAANNTQAMVDLIGEVSEQGNNDILVVFDCCDMNTGFLDKFLEDMINKTPYANVQIETIAVQRYCAIKTSLPE